MVTDRELEETPAPGTVETDRFVVLLECGHWTQTRRPHDATYWCDRTGKPRCDTEQRPVTDEDTGQRAILCTWDYVGPDD